MKTPTTLGEVKQLIDMRIEESLHLDYKNSNALSLYGKHKKEITKDVSSFANADGGVIIYGVDEEEHLPVNIDDGVDHSKISKEWIEQVASNITPQIIGLVIYPIRLSDANSIYVVEIPKSFRGPHYDQNNNRYYRRRNFQSTPMEHYEIIEFQSRSDQSQLLVNFELYMINSNYVGVRVSNPGKEAAKNIQFTLPELVWRGRESIPGVFTNGIRELPPERELKYMLAQYGTFLDDGENPTQFEVSVSYDHPRSENRVRESFSFDLNDYHSAVIEKNDIENLGIKLSKDIQGLSKQVENLTGKVEKIAALAGATGLNLSATTLKNLAHLQSDQIFEKYLADDLSPQGFVEVLGVPTDLAFKLWHFFRWGKGKNLQDVEGMTDEILGRFHELIKIQKETENSH